MKSDIGLIPFNIPTITGAESGTIHEILNSHKFCGDGPWTKKCHAWLKDSLQVKKALLTTSCTHALEMAALLSDIRPGDEVILPSFTFVSTANAFVLRGAKLVFVDVDPLTMNLDIEQTLKATSARTRAIVVVHYGGVACDMDALMKLKTRFPNLAVIEDAAQGIGATYKGKPLGGLADFGCFSFHETKNLHCGEGGALTIMHEKDIVPAEIIREKGTNRSQFIRGQVDKYTWQDVGSSYLCSDLNAAFLFPQLQSTEAITNTRRKLWDNYDKALRPLEEKGLGFLKTPAYAVHNGHIYWVKLRDEDERNQLLDFFKGHQVQGTFHYIPLHSSPAGKKYGTFFGEDKHTEDGAGRLIRLPIFDSMTQDQQMRVVDLIYDFMKARK